MGFELRYQAIPADGLLIERARRDRGLGESLGMLPIWFGGGRPPAPGREPEPDDPLWAECCRLAGRHPALTTLRADLDRAWDALHYVLSATRRGEPAGPPDRSLDRAFDAGEVIAEHVRATQGVLIRHLPAPAVREIAALVDPLDFGALRRHFDLARMEGASVYKVWADRDVEAAWTWVGAAFDEFRRFFRDATAAGYAAIVCLD